jgi:hypothetical protein
MNGKPGVRRTVDEFCQEGGYGIKKIRGSLVLLKKQSLVDHYGNIFPEWEGKKPYCSPLRGCFLSTQAGMHAPSAYPTRGCVTMNNLYKINIFRVEYSPFMGIYL